MPTISFVIFKHPRKIGLMMRWIADGEGGDSFRKRQPLKSFVHRMTLRAALLGFTGSFVAVSLLAALGLVGATGEDGLRLATACGLVAAAVAAWLGLRTGRMIDRLARSNARFEQLSRTDALSGLLNRRAFADVLARAKAGCSLVIIDVDRFKSINDTYGHTVGDDVIRRVAELIAETAGPGAPASRLGGEEFGFLLSNGTIEDRLAMVERLRERIEAEVFHGGQADFTITISAGLAEVESGKAGELTYAAADKALYLAKAGGRNRVVHDRQGLTLILDMVAAERLELENEAAIARGVA